jgi:hypothetical protein
MLKIEKNWRSKRDFQNFLAESFFALGKEICAECFFLCVSFFVGSRQTSFFAGSFLFGSGQSVLCRELFILLLAKTRTLGKACDSGSGCG